MSSIIDCQVEIKHFADSLLGVASLRSVLPRRHPALARRNNTSAPAPAVPELSLIDIGTLSSLTQTLRPLLTPFFCAVASGAGFPALPLYILYGPHNYPATSSTASAPTASSSSAAAATTDFALRRLTLCDSQLQKCKFLDHICTALSAVDARQHTAELAELEAAERKAYPQVAALLDSLPPPLPRAASHAHALDLSAVEIVQKRAEDLGRESAHARKYVPRSVRPSLHSMSER